VSLPKICTECGQSEHWIGYCHHGQNHIFPSEEQDNTGEAELLLTINGRSYERRPNYIDRDGEIWIGAMESNDIDIIWNALNRTPADNVSISRECADRSRRRASTCAGMFPKSKGEKIAREDADEIEQALQESDSE